MGIKILAGTKSKKDENINNYLQKFSPRGDPFLYAPLKK
jgi:hypothetical protein